MLLKTKILKCFIVRLLPDRGILIYGTGTVQMYKIDTGTIQFVPTVPSSTVPEPIIYLPLLAHGSQICLYFAFYFQIY
jgi:hypothetical protein